MKISRINIVDAVSMYNKERGYLLAKTEARNNPNSMTMKASHAELLIDIKIKRREIKKNIKLSFDL